MNTWGDAPLRIYRASYRDAWFWECAYCHYGHNIPWDEAPTWNEALSAVEAHIQRHRELGKVETWAYALVVAP